MVQLDGSTQPVEILLGQVFHDSLHVPALGVECGEQFHGFSLDPIRAVE